MEVGLCAHPKEECLVELLVSKTALPTISDLVHDQCRKSSRSRWHCSVQFSSYRIKLRSRQPHSLV